MVKIGKYRAKPLWVDGKKVFGFGIEFISLLFDLKLIVVVTWKN